MKKLCFLLLASALFYACGEKTNEDRAKESIERYLKESMNDWDSYEFVDMEYLDSLYNVNGEKISDIKFDINYRLDSINYAIFINSLSEIGAKEEAKVYKDKLDSLIRTKHDKKFIGWETNFTFRGNNKFGAKVINTLKVQLDKDFFIDNVESVE